MEKRENLWVAAGFTGELKLAYSTLPSSSVTHVLQSLILTLRSRKAPIIKIPSTIVKENQLPFNKTLISKYSPSLMNRGFLMTARRMLDKLYAVWRGNRVFFSRDEISLGKVSEFAKKVLFLTMKVPRGFVTSYGEIARFLGNKKFSRAVARILSKNPIPLAIPCHRVVYFDGRLGGFSAEDGVRVKRQLLEREGVQFTLSGKVRQEHIVGVNNLDP